MLTGRPVALKVYRLEACGEQERLHLFREITLHARLSHPNVLQFYAAFKVSRRGVAYGISIFRGV